MSRSDIRLELAFMNLGQSHVPDQAVERETIEQCVWRADIAVERLSLVMFPVCLRLGQLRADEVQWIGPKAFMIDRDICTPEFHGNGSKSNLPAVFEHRLDQ
jgi:hypothetical protein